MTMRIAGYWISTTLIAMETFAGGWMDLTRGRAAIFSGPSVAEVTTSLGYPLYVLLILGAAKIPGAVVLVIPGFLRLKEWAYAGIVFELLGAIASNTFCRHMGDLMAPSAFLVIAIASWILRPEDRILGRLRRRSSDEVL